MNYIKHYEKLINRAINGERQKNKGVYYEKHHILPECIGGTKHHTNLVLLTAREHFVAHILLVKIYPHQHRLIYAVNKMCRFNKRQDRSKNRMYGWLKEKFSTEVSRNQSGIGNSQYGTCWVFNVNKELSKKIKKSEIEKYLSEGWEAGRVVNFENYKHKLFKKATYQKQLLADEEKKREYYIELYDKFIKSDCVSIREFQRSNDLKIQTIIDNWKKYVVGFNPLKSIKYKETLEP